MPAISTTFRSCISPQRPRAWGLRRAATSAPVSPRRRSCDSTIVRSCCCSTLELFRDRRHQLLDRLLALLQFALGLALIRAQSLLGQRQELLVVLLQRVGR